MSMCFYLFVLYFCGIWSFSSSRKHLLVTLLSLEFIVLVLYLSGLFLFVWIELKIVFCCLFFSFFCLGGSLGLSIFGFYNSYPGNDYFRSYSVLQC
uniref:NADH dehydrogenase subunit 4L n=1 Tax=Reticulitermes citrinus TaxID=2933236 RepID=A0A8T9KMJ3_9NEOP|nr:NADH dehydrogenase subunit 4L [Reticulitermes citrinus]UOL50322.1 NADH dehydrogenase subunit 4L [Reticulitermes citrinus]